MYGRMHKFPKISHWRSLAAYVGKVLMEDGVWPTITYRGTVKLHGTNSGIARKRGRIQFQSRNRVISKDDDNFGFAEWASKIPEEAIHHLMDSHVANEEGEDCTIFGEWIGPGVQPKVAINELPEKQFVIFQARMRGGQFFNDPILKLPEHGIHNVYDAPYYDVAVNFNNPFEAMQEIELLTQQHEDECPWAKRFGISGIGEGLVWTPVGGEYAEDTDLWFKSKGKKHSDKPVGVFKAKADTKEVFAFAEMVVTDERLKQGVDYLKEMGHPLDVTSTGKFLSWFANDVKTEHEVDMEDMNLEWKRVAKVIGTTARGWYFEQIGWTQ